MNAKQDDLQRLHQMIDEVSERIEALALLQPHGDLFDRLGEIRTLHSELRDRWAALLEPPCASREELLDRLTCGDAIARIEALARHLAEGTLRAGPNWLWKYERSLTDARREVERALETGAPPVLPGRPADAFDWLQWAWDQVETDDEDFFKALRATYSSLLVFLMDVPRESWVPPAGPLAVEDVEDPPSAKAPDAAGAVELADPEMTVVERVEETPTRSTYRQEFDRADGLLGVLLEQVKTGPPAPLAIDSESEASLPVESLPELPAQLRTFEQFERTHWITGSGTCEAAPWTSADFEARLTAGIEEGARQGRLFEVELYARAQQSQGQAPTLFPGDVDCLKELLSAPDPQLVGWDEQRRTVIEKALRNDAIEDSPRWRLRVMLEYLRPAPSHGSVPPDQAAAAKAGLLGTWLKFAVELGRSAQMGADIAKAWARREREETITEDLDLDELREALRKTFSRLYSAAGGRIERTHCRDAWALFVEAIKPQLAPLFPSQAGGTGDWEPDAVAQVVRRMPKLQKKLADRRGVKWSDRRSMEKGAQEIIEAALAVVDAKRRLSHEGAPLEPLRVDLELVGAVLHQHDDGFELELVRLALRKLLGLAVSAETQLATAALCTHPELLELLPTDSVSSVDEHLDILPADVRDPVRASALLLRPQGGDAEEDLVAAITRRGLPHLLPLLRDHMDEQDRHRVDNDRQQLLDVLLQLQGSLQEVHTGLDHLGSVIAAPVLDVLSQCERILDDDDEQDARLLRGWLERMLLVATEALEVEQQALLARLDDERRERVAMLIADRVWAEVTHLAGTKRERGDSPAVRETLWRREAVERFSDSRTFLDGHLPDPLRERWWEHRPSSSRQRGLRSHFAEWVLGKELADKAEKASDRWTLALSDVRATIDAQGRNPCFIPQINRFSYLAIETISTSADKGSFSTAAANHLATPDSSNPLRILLAPGLTPKNREATLRQLHQRQSGAAALIDDVDLCRLAQAQIDQRSGMLGLLEIAFEQLPLGRVGPFEGGDGQHVAPEMFVGRRQEAIDIATTRMYTRLFSGRKLGKSALLRAIQHRHANKRLPDGTTLRVIYVPLVGTYREKDVVDEVANRLKHELGMQLTGLGRGMEPVKRLKAMLEQLVEARPHDSFIFVCDEADQFVEDQIEAYDREKKESTLSWMIRQLEGLRCRFLFAGFRATHRREGVWENWGTTLKLQPLEREEAEELVVKPLARIGVDATNHGHALAHRCGYQPAILLRLGRSLLDQIRQDSHGFDRDGVPVTAGQVSRAFADPAVQDEIKTVVRANFHGSQIVEVVFSACLLALADLPSGAYVEGTRDKVLEQFAAIVGDESWVPEGRSAHAVIDDALLELVDRRLLARGPRSDGPGRHRLRFPHHLSVLLDLEPERVLRERLSELADGAAQYAPNSSGFLEPGQSTEVRELLDEAQALGISAVALCSSWQLALEDERNGLLGTLERDTLAIDVHSCCSPSEARQVLREGRPALLTGGPDLLEWAVEMETNLDVAGLVEARALDRLPINTVRWWFQRARGIEFAVDDGLARIFRVTRGIPDLVALIDQTFPSAGGETVSGHQVTEAVQRVDQHLVAGGPTYLRATDRDLLRVVLRVHDELHTSRSEAVAVASDIQDALSDPDLLAGLVDDASPALQADAGTRIRVLQMLGWLPVLPGGVYGPSAIGRIDADDPLRKLLQA